VRRIARFAVCALLLGAGGTASAQERPDTVRDTVPVERPEDEARPLLAVGEALFVNVAVNRFDALLLGHDWARVGPDDWSRNLRLGWEWDENAFPNNMFSHPYHGSLYFNAGRSNGLTFWESTPVVFLGSWTWEYLGETHRPSLNDFYMTGFGGVAMGEVLHRLAASVRDERATGGARLLREVAALPLDPVGGLNRLLRGRWTRLSANPPERSPGSYVLRLRAGARVVADSGFVDGDDTVSGSPTFQADLIFGDPFLKPYAAPFDVFAVRAQVSPGSGGLNEFLVRGRLFGIDLDREGHLHAFALNQRLDYMNNPAHKFGAQSIEAGIYSRWRLGRRSALRTQAFVGAVVLGALDAPFAGVGDRVYDFGPGVGFRLEASYERNGLAYVTLRGRTEYLHSISGAAADHNVSLGSLELSLPVAARPGAGLQLAYFNRLSRYLDRPDELREFPQARLFLEWTGAILPGFARD
jgi:hypothetical protein